MKKKIQIERFIHRFESIIVEIEKKLITKCLHFEIPVCKYWIAKSSNRHDAPPVNSRTPLIFFLQNPQIHRVRPYFRTCIFFGVKFKIWIRHKVPLEFLYGYWKPTLFVNVYCVRFTVQRNCFQRHITFMTGSLCKNFQRIVYFD